MKQKLALCCALIHRPVVLFLDEPTTGVDTVSRKEFWEMLKRLKQQGITILVSTPYMDEATLCERIALIQSGKIMSINTPENIVKQYPENLYAIKATDMGKLLRELRKYDQIKSCNSFGEYHHISFNNDRDISSTEKLLQYLGNSITGNIELKKTTATIEDCFIQLMKN
jgi:ABC-type multidrug transport system ATPase subunit